MEKLPNEIVLKIFNHIESPSDLLTCRLVSARWRALIDLVFRSRPADFWRSACLTELDEFSCDSVLADSGFDRFFPAFVRPSVAVLRRLPNEALWRAVYCSYWRLSGAAAQRAPLCRITFSSSLRISDVVLHAGFLIAACAGPEMSVGCVLLAPLSACPAGPSLILRPSVFHSSPGVFHGLAVMPGFPVPGCPELVGPLLERCPLCGDRSDSLLEGSAAHVTVQVVHKYRGLELIGLCLRREKPLPEATWWKQSTRPVEGSCDFVASLHKAVCQVVYRRRTNSFRHLYHLRGGCEGCTEHEQKILTSGSVLAASTTECCSVELFERFSGDRSHRLQATVVWGDERGAGAVADDLRGGSGDGAIAASALLLQEPTALVAFSRVQNGAGPGGLPSWTHCLMERDLSRPDQPRAFCTPLGDISPRRVVRIAAKGPITLLGTDAGKVVALRSRVRGLATAIAQHHCLKSAGHDSDLVLLKAGTDGSAVSCLHMSLQPRSLRAVVATLGEHVFFLQL